MNGIFTVSLDFELHWGGFEKWPLEKYKSYFDRTRETIPTLLKLFERAEIHATWATVGMLMHENKRQLEANMPESEPAYENSALSAYNYIRSNGIGAGEAEDPYHYAHTIIQDIIATPDQELATHTFAHYYCNEKGQNADQFLADLKAAKKAAEAYGVELTSLVFPRNQYNPEYLKACKKAGINAIRTNPSDWWWQVGSTQDEPLRKKLYRFADAYFPLGEKTSFPLSAIAREEGVLKIPASRLLRPYNPREFFLNDVKISRIKKEMEEAARNNEVYHLWWHPHNFGNFPAQNIEGLTDIVNHYLTLKQQYNYSSYSMSELTKIIE